MKSLFRISALVLLLASIVGALTADVPKKNGARAWKPTVFEYKQLDGNTINCTVASDGPYADYRRTNSSGLEWPRGTGKTAIYTAGIWLVGQHGPTGALRTAQMDYNSEYQPGPLLETFNTTTNADAAPISRAGDARYRLYKVARNKPDGDATRLLDAWSLWPGDLGAPYVDVDSSGTWNADTDVPDFRGDQMMWSVINDVNQGFHTSLGNTRPMGVEIQTLYFVFNQPGALGNIMFMKWRIINKSDADYNNVYIGMWSDIDLGDGNDDLPGCDTTLSLGYVYNGDNDDVGTTGYGTKPPAVGFDFFQGPIVPGAPTDSALVSEKWRYGYRNLPATAFVVYCNSTFPQLVDPPDGDPDYALQAYDYLKGKAGTIHQYVINKVTGDTVRFFFSGDPVTNTGDLPGGFATWGLGTFAPQDVRVMLASGPFTLAQGDTQEIVGSIILAQGADRLNSVTLLKGSDQIAQNAFNDNFNVPGAPPLPDVTVTELPNELIFEWQEKSEITEAYDFRGNRFEGYNFYQGESTNGPWKKIATYDIINGVTMIEDMVMNQDASKTYLQPVQFGTDSGIKRSITLAQDAILSTPLVNGKPYYYALTTYSYNPDPNALILGVPVSLESAKDAIVATPQGAAIGSEVPTASGQVLAHSRSLDDAVVPEILNPAALNGASYSVVLNGVDTTVTSWSVVRSRGGVVDTAIANSTDFTGSSSSPIVDGVQVRVSRPVPGVRRDAQPAPARIRVHPVLQPVDSRTRHNRLRRGRQDRHVSGEGGSVRRPDSDARRRNEGRSEQGEEDRTPVQQRSGAAAERLPVAEKRQAVACSHTGEGQLVHTVHPRPRERIRVPARLCDGEGAFHGVGSRFARR